MKITNTGHKIVFISEDAHLLPGESVEIAGKFEGNPALATLEKMGFISISEGEFSKTRGGLEDERTNTGE